MDVLQVGILIIVLLILQGVGLWFLFGRKQEEKKEDGSGLMLLQQHVQDLAKTLDARMGESSRQMHDTVRSQLGESAKLIREITQEITSVKEIGRQTQSFAEQLQNLQDILKNPKQRGILGEYYLESALKNVLAPGAYQMQYPFKNGEIVDAAVFLDRRIVPIDSKFSLDNYNRFVSSAVGSIERSTAEKAFVNDLKLRITETAKYIRPEENTMDFAFMFIPSDVIYYDLLTNQVGAGEEESLLQRAASKYKVIVVSPTTFHAWLQTVMQGLKALQIEKQAEEIQKRVGELGKHIGSYEEYYKKLGNALGTAVSHYNSGYKELGKIDKDVYRITGDKLGVEQNLLDKPSVEID
jgi:DNA recombination protein RmuC